MKTAIGHIPVYTIIIIFIVITFGFLSATLTYYKAFKLNSRIAYQLEKFEGFNDLSEKEIQEDLSAMGYRTEQISSDNCPTKNMNAKIDENEEWPKVVANYPVCIYKSKNGYSDNAKKYKNRYFKYGIVTFIYLDIPLVGGVFKVPVYTESERIFEFKVN